MRTLEQGAPELRRLELFGAVDAAASAAGRHEAALAAARSLRLQLQEAAPVEAVQAFPLLQVGYPSRFAFWGALLAPSPFVLLEHRALAHRFFQGRERRLLLFNPSEPLGLLRVPYARRLLDRLAPLSRPGLRFLEPLEPQLARAGIDPEEVDYVAFDHFHLQDLRPLLGTADGTYPGRFPRAKLLVQADEWHIWEQGHPLHRPFLVPDGREGVREERVVELGGDVWLSDAVALVRTPGHTRGNQTLFLRTARGIWGCSENGVCADSWAPQASRMPGVATRARDQELEALPNLDTPESGTDQYTSMLVERAVVDPVATDAAFVQMYPSFEVIPSVLAPGSRPSVSHGRLQIGVL